MNPNYATEHQWHAELKMITGHPGELIREMKQALQMDPFLSLSMEGPSVRISRGKKDQEPEKAYRDYSVAIAAFVKAYTICATTTYGMARGIQLTSL